MQIKISVIIPAYNAAKYLEQTLLSVFSQTYTNFEVIVVNDGSTDETETLLLNQQKHEPRLKIISQTNQGISAARNAGIDHATGDFIAFIDSDDNWDASFLAKMIARQQQTHGDVIYTGNIDCSSKGHRQRISDFRENANLAGYLTQQSLLHIGCLLIRKSFLYKNKLRFNTELKTGEDIVFICSLYCLTTAFSVPEYLYLYIHRDDSISRKPWTKQDYLNDLNAWQQLEMIINRSYQASDRNEICQLIESKVVYYKLRLLWLLLLSARYDEVKLLLDKGFLTYTEKNLTYLPAKYAGIRRKIIESKSPLIWCIAKAIHRKKVNLI